MSDLSKNLSCRLEVLLPPGVSCRLSASGPVPGIAVMSRVALPPPDSEGGAPQCSLVGMGPGAPSEPCFSLARSLSSPVCAGVTGGRAVLGCEAQTPRGCGLHPKGYVRQSGHAPHPSMGEASASGPKQAVGTPEGCRSHEVGHLPKDTGRTPAGTHTQTLWGSEWLSRWPGWRGLGATLARRWPQASPAGPQVPQPRGLDSPRRAVPGGGNHASPRTD